MGSATFTGKVSAIHWTCRSAEPCPFQWDLRLHPQRHLVGTVAGDVLTGTVTYTFATNKTDCGTRDTCQDTQVFNGTGLHGKFVALDTCGLTGVRCADARRSGKLWLIPRAKSADYSPG